MKYAPTVQCISHRLMLCLSPCEKSLLIFLRDISQSYTQFEKYIQRKVFIEPPTSLNFGTNNLLRVVKSLYGLPESRLYWFETYHHHHTDNMNMEHAVHDVCFLFHEEFFFWYSAIRGATCLRTDDTLNLGTALFMKKEKERGRQFA